MFIIAYLQMKRGQGRSIANIRMSPTIFIPLSLKLLSIILVDIAVMETHKRGFTLIELSIVLVIIGLIVGGILVGRELMVVAEVRSQVSQIEKMQTAVNIFRNKYNGLPGDLINASQVGLSPRSGAIGNGNGDGRIQNAGGGGHCLSVASGETLFFWSDLATAGLTENNFTYSGGTPADTNDLSPYFPRSKLGTAYLQVTCGIGVYTSQNYLVLMDIRSINSGIIFVDNPFTVLQAYMIDSKIDDGFPVGGRVIEIDYYNESQFNFAAGYNCLGSLNGAWIYPLNDPVLSVGKQCGLRIELR
jgi:prepilin-type N-terminal cleavage/methylation domain-containing protein